MPRTTALPGLSAGDKVDAMAASPSPDHAVSAPLSEGVHDTRDITGLALAFKALGDPVRLRLMQLIASDPGGEVCVRDLMPKFDLTGPTISHHLRVLRESGLVTAERRRTWVYYKVVPDLVRRLSSVLNIDPDRLTPRPTAPPPASAHG
jgi:ArsR family transcriptional regulator